MFLLIIFMLLAAILGAAQEQSTISIVIVTIPRTMTTSRWVATTATQVSTTVTFSELIPSRWTTSGTFTYTAAASFMLSTSHDSFSPSSSPVPLASSIAVSTTESSAPTPAPLTSPVMLSTHDSKIPPAALTGLIIGIIALLIVFAIVVVYFRVKERRSQVRAAALGLPLAAISPPPSAPSPPRTPQRGSPLPEIPDVPLSALSPRQSRPYQGHFRRSQLSMASPTRGAGGYESSFDNDKRDRLRQEALAKLEAGPPRSYSPSVYSGDGEVRGSVMK